MTSPAPPNNDPNGQDANSGNPLVSAGNAINQGIAGLLGDSNYNQQTPGQTVAQAGGAITSSLLGGLGIKLNAVNVVLNTLLYGTIALIGGVMVYKGVRLLVTGDGGAGVKDVVMGAIGHIL